jgi:VCBS repeat-containing protein
MTDKTKVSGLKWILMALPVLMALACNGRGDSTPVTSDDTTSGDTKVESYELASMLPACTPSRKAEVYYVRSEDQFYVCDGKKHRPIDISGPAGKDGKSLLVDTVEAPASVCPTGGVLLRIGPDDDKDGILDAREIRVTIPLCNGAVGPQGPRGEDGADGESCTLQDNGDGTGTITCPDGNSLTVVLAGAEGSPVANPDTYTVAEDALLTVPAPGVLGNDTDPDGDALMAIPVSSPSQGVLTLNADGSFVYAPNRNFNGTDGFLYQVSDGTFVSGMASVTIVVTAVNDAPTATADTFAATEDTILNVAAPGVLGNDADPENDALTAVLVRTTSNGVLTFDSDGSFSYSPNRNFYGMDSFTYKANDGALDSNVATVTISVLAVNDAPTATPDTFATGEDVPLNVPAPGVLDNDADPEGSALTAILDSGTTNGLSFTLNSDGSFTYVPNLNFNGTDQFTYPANDGAEDSAITTVTIVVGTPP